MKESYPLQSANAEKPDQDETSGFDLYDEDEHDVAYLEAMLADSNPEIEKQEVEKMPEAAEDQSY